MIGSCRQSSRSVSCSSAKSTTSELADTRTLEALSDNTGAIAPAARDYDDGVLDTQESLTALFRVLSGALAERERRAWKPDSH
jgi:hypothetical protein